MIQVQDLSNFKFSNVIINLTSLDPPKFEVNNDSYQEISSYLFLITYVIKQTQKVFLHRITLKFMFNRNKQAQSETIHATLQSRSYEFLSINNFSYGRSFVSKIVSTSGYILAIELSVICYDFAMTENFSSLLHFEESVLQQLHHCLVECTLTCSNTFNEIKIISDLLFQKRNMEDSDEETFVLWQKCKNVRNVN